MGSNDVGIDTRLHAFGAWRMTLFTTIPKGGLFSNHIHSYFQPLTKLIDEFGHAIFQVWESDGEEVITCHKAFSTYESVLAVLNRAFNDLPDIDPAPPNPFPLLIPAPSLDPALSGTGSSLKKRGKFKVPSVPICKSP